jgi:hypothetical protein
MFPVLKIFLQEAIHCYKKTVFYGHYIWNSALQQYGTVANTCVYSMYIYLITLRCPKQSDQDCVKLNRIHVWAHCDL